MGLKRGQAVLVDTNVILESHRSRTWDHLTAHFSVETVSECVAECETGNQRLDNPVPVDIAALRERMLVHSVSQAELTACKLLLRSGTSLDAGEEHLIAYALTREDVWLIGSPDKAAASRPRIFSHS